jgi:2-methylcitrate dehydratase PrpD
LVEVDRVVVRMSELAIRQASKPVVTNLNAAMGSTQFSLALALAAGNNGLKEYWEGYKDRSVHEGMNKVELQAEPAYGLGGRQSVVEITLKDGRKVQRSSQEPKGEPTNALTHVELERKFLAMTTMVVDEAQAWQIGELVMNLEQQAKAAVVPQATVVDNGPALRAA